MKIEQINNTQDTSANNSLYQNFVNLYNNAGKCIFKLMVCNDSDIGNYFDFYNEDGTKKFHFTLKNNKISAYIDYEYEIIGKCKKQIGHLTNIEMSFQRTTITYLDEHNEEIYPNINKSKLKTLTNKKFLQLQLDIVNKINETSTAK